MTYPWKGAAHPMSPDAFKRAAKRIGCDVAAIRAVWDVEASGRGYQADGTVLRRFEPHKMPFAKTNWRDSLKIPTAKRERMFLDAYQGSPTAALEATSWGGPQIMGFNAHAAGHASAEAMVRAMADGEGAQLAAFVSLVLSWRIDGALRAGDWLAFARRYNGSGQAATYARKIEARYRHHHHRGDASPEILRVGARGEGVKRLQRALGIEDDGAFGPETLARVEDFQRRERLPVDGVVGRRTWDALKAKTGVQPKVQPTTADDVADKVTRWTTITAAITAAATGIREALPGGAFELLAYGAVGLALVAAAALMVRRFRGAA